MTQPIHVTVKLDEGRGYDIVIGAGLLDRAHEYILPLLPTKRAIIITDENVEPLYSDRLGMQLHAKGVYASGIKVKPGEGSKSFASFERVAEHLLSLKVDRRTTIIALGGGVVGDLAGFLASVLMRGMPFIQIPTSLLAQVDSSVGGKTAINTTAGKNLVGSFYQPKLVLADSEVLQTLPAREMQAGYAEIIKYGLIMDKEFYRWCLANGAKLLSGDQKTLQYAVEQSCRMKAAIVEADEREADTRALLNFGHTFAHALEAETGFSDTLIHGEAVAIGMVMALRLSARLGMRGDGAEQELAAHFKALGMKAYPRDVDTKWDAGAIARHFSADKKAEDGKLTFVTLKALGEAQVVKHVDATLAYAVVASFLN